MQQTKNNHQILAFIKKNSTTQLNCDGIAKIHHHILKLKFLFSFFT